MPTRRVKGGSHAARHRAPTRLERSLDRAVEIVPSGRSVAVAAVGGMVATGAVIGMQVPVDADNTVAAVDDATTTADAPTTSPSASDETAAAAAAGTDDSFADSLLERGSGPATTTSRFAERPSLSEAKQQQLQAEVEGADATVVETLEIGAADPRDIARSMLADYGWSEDQWPCLDDLWIGESNWDHTATNPTSGAYGIPQSLPAEKMAAAGPDWQTNPVTQIEWGFDYIADRYGSPCAANDFKLGNNWY